MRTEIPVVVLGSDGRPLAGASVTIKTRPGGATAIVYQADTGAATSPNPLTSDAQGRVNGWLERGAYDAQIVASGLPPWTEPIDAAPAGDGGIDGLWLPDGVVATRSLADGAVTAAKLAADSVTNPKLATDSVGADEIIAGAVGTAELANLAVSVAKIASGAALRLLTSFALPAFNIGNNTTADRLAATNVAFTAGRTAYALVLDLGGNSSAGTAAAAWRLYLDGVQVWVPGMTIGPGRVAYAAALVNLGVLAGNHTLRLTVEQGNTPATVTNDGVGSLIVLDQ